jgi:hypothetical protein
VKNLWSSLSQVLIGSIEYRETVLRRLIFQTTEFLFKQTHFPMDPNACLCYPSQPGVTQTFPEVSLAVWCLLSWWGGVYLQPRGSSQAVFSAGPVSPATPSGRGDKGHAHKWRLPPRQGFGMDSDSMVSDKQEGERGFGFWIEFIYLVVTSPPLLSTLSP